MNDVHQINNQAYIKIDSIKLKQVINKVEKFLIDLNETNHQINKKEVEEYNIKLKEQRKIAILEQYNKYKNKKTFWLFKRKNVISLEEFIFTKFNDYFNEREVRTYDFAINDSQFNELKTLISYNVEENYDILLPAYLLKYIETNFGFKDYTPEDVKKHITIRKNAELAEQFLNMRTRHYY